MVLCRRQGGASPPSPRTRSALHKNTVLCCIRAQVMDRSLGTAVLSQILDIFSTQTVQCVLKKIRFPRKPFNASVEKIDCRTNRPIHRRQNTCLAGDCPPSPTKTRCCVVFEPMSWTEVCAQLCSRKSSTRFPRKPYNASSKQDDFRANRSIHL